MNASNKAVVFGVSLVALLAPALAWGEGGKLTPGDKAPALDVGEWVQGEPVKGLDLGKIYVVEFWATWCGPCRATIPHLNELSKKYPDVTFIGADVWEQDESLVAPFVKEMGGKMTYRVAKDNKKSVEEGAMATTWMKAAGQNGIPCAFIVDKESKVAWVGHPMGMAKPLAQVIDGTFDLKAEAERVAAQAKIQQTVQQKVMASLGANKPDEALAGLEEVIKEYPAEKEDLSRMRVGILLQAGRMDEMYAAMDDALAGVDVDADQLNSTAWSVLTARSFAAKRDAARAAKWALRAVELTQWKEAGNIDTLARAYAQQGDFDKAIETEQKAVAASEGDQRAGLAKTLEAYKLKKLPDAE